MATMADPCSRRRRFTLFDGLLLVAVTAVGLAPMQYVNRQSLFVGDHLKRFTAFEPYVMAGRVHASPLLVAWTLATLVLTLRSPRPPLRRLVLQPGFAACLAATLATIYHTAYFILQSRASPGLFWTFYLNQTLGVQITAGLMILGAWLPLALAGRWRRGPSWKGCLGCTVGATWLAFFGFDFLWIAYRLIVLR